LFQFIAVDTLPMQTTPTARICFDLLADLRTAGPAKADERFTPKGIPAYEVTEKPAVQTGEQLEVRQGPSRGGNFCSPSGVHNSPQALR
jgi:hypothetical protein